MWLPFPFKVRTSVVTTVLLKCAIDFADLGYVFDHKTKQK